MGVCVGTTNRDFCPSSWPYYTTYVVTWLCHPLGRTALRMWSHGCAWKQFYYYFIIYIANYFCDVGIPLHMDSPGPLVLGNNLWLCSDRVQRWLWWYQNCSPKQVISTSAYCMFQVSCEPLRCDCKQWLAPKSFGGRHILRSVSRSGLMGIQYIQHYITFCNMGHKFY